METGDAAAERKKRLEGRASKDMMRLLTGGLTHAGDAFLLGVGAVILFGMLYPLLDAWALLSFPAVLLAVVLIRSKLQGRP
jgi:hypothetical protein